MRRFLYFTFGIIAILFVFVSLIPTLISTKTGQKIATSWINETISGSLQIKQLQLGWLSDQKIEGFDLKDKEGHRIFAFDCFHTKTSLLSFLFNHNRIATTELINPYLNYIEEADGSSNIEKTVFGKEEKAKKEKTHRAHHFPKLRGDLAIENGTFIFKTSTSPAITLYDFNMEVCKKEKTLNVEGKIEQEGQQGSLLITGQKGVEPFLIADIENLPVSLLDALTKKTYFTKAIGPKLNLKLELHKQQKQIVANLNVESNNLNGKITGATENNYFRVNPSSTLVFSITPPFFDTLIHNPKWSLGNKTQVTLKVNELLYPLSLKKLDFSKIPLTVFVTVERAEISSQQIGNFSFNDFALIFSNKGHLSVDYSGQIKSQVGETEIKGMASLDHEKKWQFQGHLNRFPLPILELFSIDVPPVFGSTIDLSYQGTYKNKKLNANFDLLSKLFSLKGHLTEQNLNGKGQILIPKYLNEYLGENPLFDLNYDFKNPYFSSRIHNEKIDFEIQGEPKPLKLKALGKFYNLTFPQSVDSFDEGSAFFELNSQTNEGVAKINLYSSKELMRSFEATVDILDFMQGGQLDFKKAQYLFHSTASSFPLQFINLLFKKDYPLTTFLGNTLDFKLDGSYLDQPPAGKSRSHFDLDATGEGVQISLGFSRDDTFNLTQDKHSYIRWEMTPERYHSLLHLLNISEKPSYELVDPAMIVINLKDFVCPTLPQKNLPNFFSECGIVGELSSQKLNFVNNQGHHVAISGLKGLVHGEDFSKSLYVDLKGHFEAPNIPLSQEAGFSFVGEVQDSLTDDGRFNRDRLKIKGEFDFNLIPVKQILGVIPMKEENRTKIYAILGDLLNAKINGEIQNLTGPLTIDIKASNFKTLIPIYLNSGTVTLRDNVQAEITLTPLISETFLKDINPLIITGAVSNHPVRIFLDANGFSLPLKNFSLSRINIERAVIDLGLIRVRNGGSLQSLMEFLKAANISPAGDMNAWFTPIYLSLKNGVVYYQRFDMLLAEFAHIALWGNIDLPRDYVNMVLGVSPSTLQQKFEIKGIDDRKMFQIKMTGPTEHVELDWSAATARIGVLIAKSSAGILGNIIGGIVEQVVNASLGEEITPPPTTYPFPWERRY